MPDMTGWTKEEVIAFETLTQTKVTTKGSGFVSNQSVNKGQKIDKKDKVEVSLSAEAINGESSTTSSEEKESSKADSDKNDDNNSDSSSDKQSE